MHAPAQKRQHDATAPPLSGSGQRRPRAGVGLPLFMQTKPRANAAGAKLQRQCAGASTSSANDECTTCNSGKPLQAKLTIGASDDPLELEADRVAEQVLAAAAAVGGAPMRIQRFTGSPRGEMSTVPDSVDRVLAGSGRPLEPTLQQDMEQRFGHDFSRVRVHADGAAEQSARDVNANAYTVGHDIVFDEGRFAPETHEGQRLIAHELTHVVQQSASGGMDTRQSGDKNDLSPIALQQHRGDSVLHRQVHGPKASATPADWKDKVSKATTSADRAALIFSVVTPVKVVDKTADAATDTAVDPTHCIKWDDANPTVSYDNGLNAKKGRAANAGFTKSVTSGPSTAKKTDFYIVLGPKALDAKDLTTTVSILNHEFDHVIITRGGSTLTGDESEIETWTATFVREFHRSYSIRERRDGITSYIAPGFATFTQLGGYYASSTDTKVKADAVKNIADYYATTIKPHAVHDKVFRYWIYRGINALKIAALCGDVNDKLGKIVDPTKDVKDYWEMPTAVVKAAKFDGPPAVTVP